MENFKWIAMLAILGFWIYWYYRITKRIAPKIWGFLHITYHVLVIYLCTFEELTFKEQVGYIVAHPYDDAALVYFFTPFIFGFVWGFERIIKTNFSVNLFEWFGVRKKTVRDIDTGILTYNKQRSTFHIAAVLIPVILVFLIIVIVCVLDINSNERTAIQTTKAVDSSKNTLNSLDTSNFNTRSVNGYKYYLEK